MVCLDTQGQKKKKRALYIKREILGDLVYESLMFCIMSVPNIGWFSLLFANGLYEYLTQKATRRAI